MNISPEKWRQLKGVVADAMEHETTTRTAFLRQSFADDTTLLREATALLKEAETISRLPDDGFEACAENAVTSLRRVDSDQVGRRMGAYVLREELGRGGMGAVYLAERADGEFEKKVAIKLLKRGTDTDEVLRRFRAERQILAGLEHSNIARLIDAGTTDDGLPYFVMEYVDGIPVTRYVRAKRMAIEDRLRLFLRICAAVEFAHQQRIVHRDLKPSNILVTSAGEAKLLDFGVAKIVAPQDSAHVTMTAQQRLTPASAAPEQVRGEAVSNATDVYALGALLYEMLSGKPPYSFEKLHPSREELLRVICEQPVPSLNSVAEAQERRFLHRDLNRIVQQALRKEPERRYPSVETFANDVERFLDGRAITARPVTLVYRTDHFLKRNKAAVIGAIAGIAALLIVYGMISYFRPIWRRASKSGTAKSESILVFPFEDLSPSGQDGYLAAGIQEEIQTDLNNVRDLRVVTRSRTANGADIGDPVKVARSLGARHVLRGTVQAIDRQIRVTAQLLDARTGEQVWAERYQRDAEDLLNLQGQLARSIVAQLSTQVSGVDKTTIGQRPTNDVEAYDLYLHARAAMNQFGVEEFRDNYLKAVALLEAALARDAQFAQAHALLAYAQLSLYKFPYDRLQRRLKLAREEADAAMALAPNLPDSRLAQARYLYYADHDYEGARRALLPVPPSASGEYFAFACAVERRLGHWDKAIENAQTALNMQPTEPWIARVLSHAYLYCRRYDDAIAVCDRAIAVMTPDEAAGVWAMRVSVEEERGELAKASELLRNAPQITMKRYRMALHAAYSGDVAQANELAVDVSNDPLEQRMALILRGMLARRNGDTNRAPEFFRLARASVDSVLDDPPNEAETLAQLGMLDALLGDREKALQETATASEKLPISKDGVTGPVVERARILVRAWTGATDEAIKGLRALVKVPGGPSAGELRFDPAWDELRSHPEFNAIMADAAQPIILDKKS